MKGTLEGRVMLLERIMNVDLPEIKEYMKKGVELRVENTEHLAEITASCKASAKYQTECDAERATIGTRVTKLETVNSNKEAVVSSRTKLWVVGSNILTLIIAYFGLKHG